MKAPIIYLNKGERKSHMPRFKEFQSSIYGGWEDLRQTIQEQQPPYVILWMDERHNELTAIIRNLLITFQKLPVIVIGKFQSNSDAVNLVRIGAVEVIDYEEDLDFQQLKRSVSEISDFVSVKTLQKKEQKEIRAHVKWMLLILAFTLLNILVALNYIR